VKTISTHPTGIKNAVSIAPNTNVVEGEITNTVTSANGIGNKWNIGVVLTLTGTPGKIPAPSVIGISMPLCIAVTPL